MTTEFWTLLIGGLVLYISLIAAAIWLAPKWFRSQFSERERFLQNLVTKSETTYTELEATVKVYRQQNTQLEQMRAERDARIVSLEQEVTKLKAEVANLERQLHAKKLIKPLPAGHEIKVLLVAPASDLPLVDAETQDVLRSGLQVTPIFSPVSQVVLTREMRAGGYDGFWGAGHMDADGNFELDNGQKLSASALTSLIRGRYKWVYLNSCNSVRAAQMLQNETDADVICTIISVPDEEAYRTGSLFANALARTGDTRAAYEESIPGGNRTYLFLAGNRARTA